MTTQVIVDVNGRYKATVTETHANGATAIHEVHGRYDGSPNPTGQKNFWLAHPADATFKVVEEYLPEVQVPKVPA